jgi:peptidoglycan/xylan/chitin deacetylase (PgdA/CDA1 family)
MRFAAVQGFNSGDQFSFDALSAEGSETPRMMSIGLHCRLIGRPGHSLERFIQYAKSHEAGWFCRRVDIARHWRERHPFHV